MSGDNRKDILAAAEELFHRFGYRKTTVAEIAQAAGIAKGAIYLHFPSKEEMFLSIVGRRLEGLSTRLEKLVARPGPPRERIVEALESIIDDSLRSKQDFFPDLRFDLGDLDLVVKISALHRSVAPKLVAVLEEWLAAQPGLGPLDPTEAAWLFIQTLFAITIRKGPDPEFDHRRYLRALSRLVFPPDDEARLR